MRNANRLLDEDGEDQEVEETPRRELREALNGDMYNMNDSDD